jgi:hypothetical protein
MLLHRKEIVITEVPYQIEHEESSKTELR